MKPHLNMNKIARALGGERLGKVHASGGFFGGLQLAAEIERRFRSPAGGGRRTNPSWTEKRLVGLSPSTLNRLRRLTERLSQSRHVSIQPMQLAALMLEKLVDELDEQEVEAMFGT
jgi:hypothetical protein